MQSSSPSASFLLSTPRSQALSAALHEVVHQPGVASAAVAAWCRPVRPTAPDGPWCFAWGHSGSAQFSTPFDLASLSKPFLALLTSHLIMQRRVRGWSTSLGELLPSIQGTPAAQATLEELLSHRAGLVPHLELYRTVQWGSPIHRVGLLRAAAQATHAPPHSAPLYSDLGYLLVGAALEEHTQSPLDVLLAQELLAPQGLELGSARMWLKKRHFLSQVAPTEIPPGSAQPLRGLVHDENAWTLAGTGFAGHAGLFGTLAGVLGAGRLFLLGALGEGPWAQLVPPLLQLRPGGSLRLGFDGITQPGSLAGALAHPETFGHLGFTGTSLWCDPARKTVSVLLCNRVYPTRTNSRMGAARRTLQDILWEQADLYEEAQPPLLKE